MAVEIDYYITMVSKNTELVNPKGSSLPFSAQGGRGKGKNSAAKKISVGSEGAAEGGCGGNSAAPERIEPRHLSEYLEGRTPKKNVLSIFRKNLARANPNSKRHFSLVSAEALRGGGGASQFPSKKVRAKDIISPLIETSRFERIAPRHEAELSFL